MDLRETPLDFDGNRAFSWLIHSLVPGSCWWPPASFFFSGPCSFLSLTVGELSPGGIFVWHLSGTLAGSTERWWLFPG